ncbi:hypothetical protein HCJ45_00540 [Listeria sp. FSL L7-1517]|uniref:hypothetical protein n=1 Tax=Listeria immobilis TaxID=2713502 RepID=UPI00164CDEF7|nr:hypothetical protein [Listeria immobilis]MBC6295609.1 hypothetical protein [Listeria immobilis]
MNTNKLLLITAAGYIIGTRNLEIEAKQSIHLTDVSINNPSQQLVDYFESLEIAKEQIIGHKNLSAYDAQNLLSRWQTNYFTTS